MQYTYPDYYNEFRCIACKCPDTCCAGWQIVIDDETLKKYSELDDTHLFKQRLNSSIDWDEEVFKQDKRRRCAFLNDNDLCDLYTALGEENLCHTCATYPRHIEEFENLREVTLSLSCPEVARILMGKKEKVTFYMEETSEEENYDEYEDFDDLMFGILQDIRSDMTDIMQDRSLPLAHRIKTIWQMADELQTHIDDGDLFYCEEVLEKYEEAHRQESASKNVDVDGKKSQNKEFQNKESWNKKIQIEKGGASATGRYIASLDMFKKLYRLEVLDEAWEQLVDETSLALYGRDEQYYEALYSEFTDWLCDNMSAWYIQAEQIVVYFLWTYLCGAVYDGGVASKVKMAAASVFFVHEILMAMWIKQEKKLSHEDIVNVVYRYSRELEHSDLNLDEMETCLA